MYVKDDVLVVGQVTGYIDVIHFSDIKATVTHSLQIKEAGDINAMSQGPGKGEFMIASQKGIIFSKIKEDNTFQILYAVEEYVGLYCVNICWAGEMNYIVVTSRPRFNNKKDVPVH